MRCLQAKEEQKWPRSCKAGEPRGRLPSKGFSESVRTAWILEISLLNCDGQFEMTVSWKLEEPDIVLICTVQIPCLLRTHEWWEFRKSSPIFIFFFFYLTGCLCQDINCRILGSKVYHLTISTWTQAFQLGQIFTSISLFHNILLYYMQLFSYAIFNLYLLVY